MTMNGQIFFIIIYHFCLIYYSLKFYRISYFWLIRKSEVTEGWMGFITPNLISLSFLYHTFSSQLAMEAKRQKQKGCERNTGWDERKENMSQKKRLRYRLLGNRPSTDMQTQSLSVSSSLPGDGWCDNAATCSRGHLSRGVCVMSTQHWGNWADLWAKAVSKDWWEGQWGHGILVPPT